MKPIYLKEAARMFARSLSVRLRGFHAFEGSSEEVCSKIIRKCFNKRKYFMVSAGHFREFYCRDFGWCAESLINLGYKKEVIQTLEYALNIFEENGKIEQSISPDGKAFTFPEEYSPDALAFLVHALRLSGSKELAVKYRPFIERETRIYFEKVVEKKTGLVRGDAYFSSIKDYALRKSSCYETCMSAMLKDDLNYLGFYNPLKAYDYEKILKKHYWTGSYFLDDLSGRKDICGDANVFPFWCGVIKDKSMLKKAVASIKSAGLDKPFPLKYTSKYSKSQKMISFEKFAGNYERDSIWSHIGLIYISVLSRVDKKEAKELLQAYENKILEHKTFLELYDADGKPFHTHVYYTDEAMLWCANFLALKKKL
jgi:hypothetical protein